MKCPKCGYENKPGTANCRICRTDLTSVQKTGNEEKPMRPFGKKVKKKAVLRLAGLALAACLVIGAVIFAIASACSRKSLAFPADASPVFTVFVKDGVANFAVNDKISDTKIECDRAFAAYFAQDGEKCAVICRTDDKATYYMLCKDGTVKETSFSNDKVSKFVQCDFSLDHIGYVSKDHKACVFDLVNNEEKVLGTSFDNCVFLSSDGTAVTFFEGEEGSKQLVAVKDSQKTVITDVPEAEVIAVSNDAKFVYYTVPTSEEKSDLMLFTAGAGSEKIGSGELIDYRFNKTLSEIIFTVAEDEEEYSTYLHTDKTETKKINDSGYFSPLACENELVLMDYNCNVCMLDTFAGQIFVEDESVMKLDEKFEVSHLFDGVYSEFTRDGKYIYTVDEESVLRRYDISAKSLLLISGNTDSFYIADDNGTSVYFADPDGGLFYKEPDEGNETVKIASRAGNINISSAYTVFFVENETLYSANKGERSAVDSVEGEYFAYQLKGSGVVAFTNRVIREGKLNLVDIYVSNGNNEFVRLTEKADY